MWLKPQLNIKNLAYQGGNPVTLGNKQTERKVREPAELK